MLNEQQIRDALHASRVIPVPVSNPHGPLGLEQLADAVTRAIADKPDSSQNVQRPLSLPVATWEKLDGLARTANRKGSRRWSASDIAVALIERAFTLS